jgi:glycosyltransferase involved in cell wall biosynthesis
VIKNSQKKIRAIIVGDGETRTELEQKCSELELYFSKEKDKSHQQPVIFTSWRSDVDKINAGLDIICLTSLNEGTPVSLIEAQAANKPVVSTRVGGIGDIVIENSTALLSGIQDEEKFCENLLRLVNDDQMRKGMGANSHAYVLEKFSYQRLVGDMSQLYYELLNKKKA